MGHKIAREAGYLPVFVSLLEARIPLALSAIRAFVEMSIDFDESY